MFSRFSQRPLLLLSFLVAGLLTFELVLGLCVQEDAFISFRYAQNLVEGRGLVFNPGERVEGYTNFLWTVMLAGGMALGADPVPLSRFMGMAASLLLVVLVFAVARNRDAERRTTGGILAAALVTASAAIAGESAQGLETIFFALLITAATLLAVSAHERAASQTTGATTRLLLSSVLFALAALTRPEGLGVFGLVTAGGLLWRLRHGLPLLSRADIGAVALFVVMYLPYWLWRFDYYGYPFPNTFYVKTGGGWGHVVRGLGYEWRFLKLNPVLALLTVWAVVGGLRQWWRARRRGNSGASPLLWLGLCLILGYLAYVVVVGGDFKKTFRFVIPVLPLWAILLDDAISRRGWPRLVRNASVTAWLLLGAILLNTLFSVPSTVRWSRRRAWDLTRRTAVGQYLAEYARSDALLAIHSAGIIPFYSGLPTIDMWGLNDLHIGHRQMPDMGGEWPSGHEKRDNAYVFSRRPTYFVDEWFYVVSDSIPNLRDRLGLDLVALGVYDDYTERYVPLQLDDGRGVHRYYFNFLERVD